MKQFKTWADFAKSYDLVLFNQAPNLGNGEVLQEWAEDHQCEAEEGESQEDCQCECEVMQWYAIAISEDEQKWLNETYKLGIFYSEVLDLYILPVYHYGTGWDYVNF